MIRRGTSTAADPSTRRSRGGKGRDAQTRALQENTASWSPKILRSFFAGGFECSTFKRRSGERMDFIAATRHDELALRDYQLLKRQGIAVAREGVRWHLVEARPGHYDFSSVAPIVAAARATGTQVIWDLCHFGWPDHLDLFSPEFATALAAYGAAFAKWHAGETDDPGFFVPINEISYFSWAAGDEGSMYPFVKSRGFELKQHLVRAAIRTMDAIREVAPASRFVHVDPIINVVASPRHPEEKGVAEAYRLMQYQAWDMLSGRLCPELGGRAVYLDIIGVNYYPHNQWFYNLEGHHQVRQWRAVRRSSPQYRPFREMLAEVYARYGRPLFVAETGAEDGLRAGWLRYICREVKAAMRRGVPLQGICLYPILNHPGWVDDRHCHNALWDYPGPKGERKIYAPLAAELRRWRKVFEGEDSVAPEEMCRQVRNGCQEVMV